MSFSILVWQGGKQCTTIFTHALSGEWFGTVCQAIELLQFLLTYFSTFLVSFMKSWMCGNWVHPQINAIEYVMWSFKYHIKRRNLRALLPSQMYISCLRIFRLNLNFSAKLKSYDLVYRIVKYYRIGIFVLLFSNN